MCDTIGTMTVSVADYTSAKIAERYLFTMLQTIYDEWESYAKRGWGTPNETLLMICKLYDPIGYNEAKARADAAEKKRKDGSAE